MITVTLRITEEGAGALAENIRPLLDHLPDDEGANVVYVILEELIRKSERALLIRNIRAEKQARNRMMNKPSIREERGE